MSRRAMIILILAIIAVHGILLWMVVATDSNEQQIAETLRQIEEEDALRSEMDGGTVPTSSGQTEPASSVQQPEPSGGTPGASAQTTPQTATTQPKTGGSAGKDPLADLPAVKDKPVPSVPSRTYVRKPKKTAAIKLDYTGAARDDISGLKGISLATTGILIDMDNNKVLWAKNQIGRAHV